MPKKPIFDIESSLEKASMTRNLSELLSEKDLEIEKLRQEIEALRQSGDFTALFNWVNHTVETNRRLYHFYKEMIDFKFSCPKRAIARKLAWDS